MSDLTFTPRRVFYFIELTHSCNLSCPICYADAGSHRCDFLDVDEVRRRGAMVKADGGTLVCLTGGEPTLHPEIEGIVHMLNREMNLSALIITNGVRIAEEPRFLPTLKRAGLKKIQLQFDTFNESTSEIMRGRRLVQQKRTAIERVCSAGVRLGLITTVCDRNLSEVGSILEFAATLTPSLNTLVFQSALPSGRFPGSVRPVDREAIISGLCRPVSGGMLHVKDFLPPPPFAPWGIAGHPDCSTVTLVCSDGRSFHALGEDVDMDALWARLPTRGPDPGVVNAAVVPLAMLLSCTRPGQRLRMLRRVLSMVRGKGRNRMFLLTVGSYMLPGFRDDERLGLCGAAMVNGSGFRRVCEYHTP